MQHGPSRRTRRPMYAAVLLFDLACDWVLASVTGWLARAALAVVLAAKATLEEQWMLSRYRSCAAYQTPTQRFIPVGV